MRKSEEEISFSSLSCCSLNVRKNVRKDRKRRSEKVRRRNFFLISFAFNLLLLPLKKMKKMKKMRKMKKMEMIKMIKIQRGQEEKK